MRTVSLIVTAFVCLCLIPWLSHGQDADDVIKNINEQLTGETTCAVTMKDFRKKGSEWDEKGKTEFEMVIKVNEEGKESISGDITSPPISKGDFSLEWAGGGGVVINVKKSGGKARKGEMSQSDPFYDSYTISFGDVRTTETGEWKYRWSGKNTIEAISKDPDRTAYTKRIITVEQRPDGWIETAIEYYDSYGLVKTRENRDFVRVGKGYRPGRIVVTNADGEYKTVLEFRWEK